METHPELLPLELLDTAPDWRLDEVTREIGRRGVRSARAALAAARRAGRDERQPTAA